MEARADAQRDDRRAEHNGMVRALMAVATPRPSELIIVKTNRESPNSACVCIWTFTLRGMPTEACDGHIVFAAR